MIKITFHNDWQDQVMMDLCIKLCRKLKLENVAAPVGFEKILFKINVGRMVYRYEV